MPPRYVFLEETFLPSLPTLQPLDLYRRTLACLVLAVSCLGGGGLWADDARTSVEQRSNAVSQVLLGIFSYVRWPKEPAVLQLCVVDVYKRQRTGSAPGTSAGCTPASPWA